MPDALVHQLDVGTNPATHAIVVGVGDYPHLPDGGAALLQNNEGLRQLSSPPLSARSFAEWLVTGYVHPDAPLGSVSLLLSESSPSAFRGSDVPPATFANVAAEVRKWKLRGDASPDNVLLFYFCGHGIGNGKEVALLMRDYGADADNAMLTALDFSRFHSGMEKCRARKQIFFVDACRQLVDSALVAQGYLGQPIFQPNPRDAYGQALRAAPIFYSTSLGYQAYSRPGEVSYFTDALLVGLQGGGSDDPEGTWRVTTSQLNRSISHSLGLITDQVAAPDGLSELALNEVSRPQVPVYVECDPSDAGPTAQFECASADATVRETGKAGDDGRWKVRLPVEQFRFSARFAAGQWRDATRDTAVRPPYRVVRLEVRP